MDVRELKHGLQKVANKELHEVTAEIQDCFDHINEWLKRQPHLNFTIDNQLLLAFLRCSKFSLERTKERIDTYYTMKTAAPEVFTNRDPFLPEIQAILNAGIILPLPKPEGEDGCRIVVFRFSDNLDPYIMTIPNLAKVMFMVMDIMLREDDQAIVSGVKTWTCCKNFSSKYAAQLTFSNLQKYLMIEEKGFPFRNKGMYYSHVPKLFEYLYDLTKVFYSSKVQERMGLYSEKNFEEIYKKIPKKLLPKEFGGSNGSINDLIDTWKYKVESYRDSFLEDEKLKSNESLRLGIKKVNSEIFGVEGSFRKLTID